MAAVAEVKREAAEAVVAEAEAEAVAAEAEVVEAAKTLRTKRGRWNNPDQAKVITRERRALSARRSLFISPERGPRGLLLRAASARQVRLRSGVAVGLVVTRDGTVAVGEGVTHVLVAGLFGCRHGGVDGLKGFGR